MSFVILKELSPNMFEYQYKFLLPVIKVKSEIELQEITRDGKAISYVKDDAINDYLMDFFSEYETVSDSQYQYDPSNTLLLVSPRNKEQKGNTDNGEKKFSDFSIMVIYPARYDF